MFELALARDMWAIIHSQSFKGHHSFSVPGRFGSSPEHWQTTIYCYYMLLYYSSYDIPYAKRTAGLLCCHHFLISAFCWFPWQGSLRTGSVFRAISKYLRGNPKIRFFQFENVVALAVKPSANGNAAKDSPKKTITGPSNLSAVCYILEQEADMWCHVWQVDSREFGSGQQRQRLYGSCFKRNSLSMVSAKAHSLLSQTMNHLVGVAPCHPEEYLLEETSAFIRMERSIEAMRSIPEKDFFCQDGKAMSIPTLFQSEGALPGALAGAGTSKRRRLKKNTSDTPSPSSAKWVAKHSAAFRELGEDPQCRYPIFCLAI